MSFDPWSAGRFPTGIRLSARWITVFLFAHTLGSCFLDENRCDANQVPLHGDLTVCVCAPNAIRDPKGYGCTLCGDNEEVKDNKCACKAGFARAEAGGACEESMLGAPCTDSAQCAAPFTFCATDRGAGYCTSQGCTSSSECAESWGCVNTGAMSYCGKPPSGQGDRCTTSEDCKGEASYCETQESQTCLVPDCATGQNSCFVGYSCCDISMVIRSIPSLCVPPEALDSAGMCPLGVRKVEP